MNARLSLRAALMAMALVAPLAAATPLAAVAPPRASKAAAPIPASLHVSPGAGYVGGQAMNFEGNIGRAGARRLTMQFHMNRPGDSWTRVEGFRGSTRANGSFGFTFKAPSMFGIRYRVASGKLATPPVAFNAQTQDLTVEVAGRPVVDRPFDVVVDTTPDDLFRRPDTKDLRPFPGRGLTLQRRQGDGSWQKIDSSVVGSNGMGYFRNVTVGSAGTVVYRVVQENWMKGSNQIGWFPSFPTYVQVVNPGSRAIPAASERVATPAPEPLPRSGTSSATASQRYGWAPSLFDFAWEFGESLTSPAHRGTDRSGWWLDRSTGAGRVAKHNGGLMLDSKRDNDTGPGDFGTTSATLRGLPQAYGRWETRLRIKSDESNARDYRVLVELVPDKQTDVKCDARNITVAEVATHAKKVTVGVNAGNKKWRRTMSGVTINNQAIAFAVEVSKRHITWFMEGRPVATVKNRAAVSGVPLTLRMSMVGNGQKEMNHTQVISDWERGFTLARGKQVRSGPALKQSRLSAPSC